MTPVTKRRIPRMLTLTEEGLAVLLCGKLLGRKIRPLVGAITEGLVVAQSAVAEPVVLPRFQFDSNGLPRGDRGFTHLDRINPHPSHRNPGVRLAPKCQCDSFAIPSGLPRNSARPAEKMSMALQHFPRPHRRGRRPRGRSFRPGTVLPIAATPAPGEG